jgi:diguanylate cyclase (GGDEF)-like protein
LSEDFFTLFSERETGSATNGADNALDATVSFSDKGTEHAPSISFDGRQSGRPLWMSSETARRRCAGMIGLINSIADLMSLRDREELEIAVAMMASDVLAASSGRLWRVIGRPDDLRLHERALLVNRRVTISDAPAEISELPTLDSYPKLRVCYEERIPLRVDPDQTGRHRHVFPVMSLKGLVGFFEIFRSTPLTDDEQRFVSGLLRIYHNHVDNLDYSENDDLTGLPNRKTFDASFTHLPAIVASGCAATPAFERIERRRPINAELPRWLAVLDIDFFKRINDRFGHQCGDKVLIVLAQLMRTCFRSADRLFRCGGEEFVIILEPTAAKHVPAVLERFRAQVEAHDFPQVGTVTISIGYTRVALDDSGLSAFQRADRALYAAKRQGRNQVISHEEMDDHAVFPPKVLVELDAMIH